MISKKKKKNPRLLKQLFIAATAFLPTTPYPSLSGGAYSP
jgi:hypothetical protein